MELLTQNDGFQNVKKPVYNYDERLKMLVERDEDKPPKSLFIELGHDEKAGAGTKHYRRYYPDELENVIDETDPSK